MSYPNYIPWPPLEISKLSESDRKRLRGARTGSELYGLFINEDINDPYPVKFYFKGGGQYRSYATSNCGIGRSGAQCLVLEPLPIYLSSSSFIAYLAKPGSTPEARIEIVDVSHIKKGDGLNGKTARKYKLVPVE